MSNPGKVTECVKLLLSQASKDMYEPSFRCFSPHLAHISAMQNFGILIAIGGRCAAKCPTDALKGQQASLKGQQATLKEQQARLNEQKNLQV